jgi:hypothetical protein
VPSLCTFLLTSQNVLLKVLRREAEHLIQTPEADLSLTVNMPTVPSPNDEIWAQWQDPGDIFSLLLLVGGDVVQKAIAQLAGVRYRIPWIGQTVYLTPVAFSFGWVAYAFTSLAAVLGDHRLMPIPDTDIQIVNCENGYARTNNSWILGRLLRDYESHVESARSVEHSPTGSSGEISLLIEIFVAEPVGEQGPRPSVTWWCSWVVIIMQQILAAIPGIVWGYWPPVMITLCGTFLAVVTAAQPQWVDEKWPGKRLRRKEIKPVALTRGNGQRYAMIVLSHNGSWDLETMASSQLHIHPSTKYSLTAIAVLWITLLLTVTGLKQHTWFLVIVGSIGSIWQTYLAARSSRPEESDISLRPWSERPIITGYQLLSEKKQELKHGKWKQYTAADARKEYDFETQEPNVRDVMGVLIELEKCIPGAGAALLTMYFPGGLDYEPMSLKLEREKEFWKLARTEKLSRSLANATLVK